MAKFGVGHTAAHPRDEERDSVMHALLDRISINPEVCGGKPCIRGTRIIPDLILVDLNLPGRDGFDVLQTIRNKPAMADVPIGVLTASDAARDRHRVAVTGRGEQYIHTPPMLGDSLDQVGDAIEDILAHK